jgi:hypothetical protein
MNSILKFLIATACICVIAVSGHYGFSVYEENQEVARQEAISRKAAMAAYDAKLQQAREESEQRSAEARAALTAECDRRVPSQSTDNLKAIYQRCLSDNAAMFGVALPE